MHTLLQHNLGIRGGRFGHKIEVERVRANWVSTHDLLRNSRENDARDDYDSQLGYMTLLNVSSTWKLR